MKKRGQLTLFVIVAIVSIIIIISFYFITLRNNELEENSNKNQNLKNKYGSNVKAITEDCIIKTLIEASEIVGMQGGYFYPPENSFKSEYQNIAYGKYEGDSTLIDISGMQKEMVEYMDIALPLCFYENLQPELNISIFLEEPIIEIKIKKTLVYSKTISKVVISSEEETIIFEDTNEQNIQTNLGDMHAVAKNIIKEKKDGYIELNKLLNTGYKINILPQGNNIFIYMILDEDYNLNEGPNLFSFAIKQ